VKWAEKMPYNILQYRIQSCTTKNYPCRMPTALQLSNQVPEPEAAEVKERTKLK
jgi:hypothetical protein